MMTIPSAMGFEMGVGFAAAAMKGSEYIDRWNADGSTKTNHCGGVQGGISNGMPVEFRVAFHPVPTLPQPVECLTRDGKLRTLTIGGRHDRCQVLRATVIVEAMAALVIADFLV
jgi:chorismate synthase